METMELVCEFGSELPGNQREKGNPFTCNSTVQECRGENTIPQGKEFNTLAFENYLGGMELVTGTATDRSCLGTELQHL